MRTHNNNNNSNNSRWLVVTLATVAAALMVGARADRPVRLRDVDALVFRAGEDVVDTRTHEVLPRLQCAYNPLGDDSVLPSAVMCENRGVDDRGTVVWKCSAELDDALRFDNVQVSCEGYSHPGDEYVREGSCVLKYTLALSSAAAHTQQPQPEHHRREPRPDPHEQGYRHYDNANNNNNHGRPHYYYADRGTNNNNNNVEEARVVSVWTFSNVLLVVLAAYVVGRCMCRCCTRQRPRVASNQNGTAENSGGHSSSSGWRWWFPLAAYAAGRHEANRARNSRVYTVPPPSQAQAQPECGCAAPSAPAAESCGADSSDSDSDCRATGHVSRRTGFADTVVR